MSSSSVTLPQTTSTVTSSGDSSPRATLARTGSHSPGPRSPSPASMCSILTPSHADLTRCFQAANSLAAANGAWPGASASARDARAAGTYRASTYSRTIRAACARGPSPANVRDHLQPAVRQPVAVGLVEQRRHDLLQQVVQGGGLQLVAAGGVGHVVGRQDLPAVLVVEPLIPPAVPYRQVQAAVQRGLHA